MKEFLTSIKQLLKIVVVFALAVIGIASLYAGYNYYKEKAYGTVDEEIGFKCTNTEDDLVIRLILRSTPATRDSEYYYSTGLIPRAEDSEVDDTMNVDYWHFHITERNIDYIYLKEFFGNYELRLNRKTLVLENIKRSSLDDRQFKIVNTNQCEETSVKSIRDFVAEKNRQANASNKI